jgi:integrase
MFEAFTGLRTCEALRMRMDAQPYEAGWITNDGKSLCVRRAKNQEAVNPFVRIHEGLAAWLKAHREWHQQRYPDSPWFFPNYRDPDNKCANSGALGHALKLRREKIGRKLRATPCVHFTLRRAVHMEFLTCKSPMKLDTPPPAKLSRRCMAVCRHIGCWKRDRN